MPRMPRWGLSAMVLILSWQVHAQQHPGEPRFVINPNHPYLYIQFDHFGPGIPRNEDEAPNRVWLRLVNNCAITISLSVNGFPEGHKPPDEVAIKDDVVADPPPIVRIVSGTPDAPIKADEKPPYGYWSDVGSLEYIRPGKSILFSLPTSQFREGWHIEIPYEFVVPGGKGPRPEDIGGQPVMYVEYDLLWLPENIQQKVEKENIKH
jgi:hypothetical protein